MQYDLTTRMLGGGIFVCKVSCEEYKIDVLLMTYPKAPGHPCTRTLRLGMEADRATVSGLLKREKKKAERHV
jgi:hypothetical protein